MYQLRSGWQCCFTRNPLVWGIIACVLAAVPVQGLSAQSTGQSHPLNAHRLDPSFDARLEAAYNQLEQSGAAVIVAVAQDGGPISVRKFGPLATDGIPAESIQFDLNSVTKTVTAIMTLRLVEDGRLRLDESLSEIFPNVPGDKATITVHHLLTHAAGFVDSVGDDDERLTREAFLRRAFATPLQSTPGDRYNYSNVGYSVLAAMIEVRSGKTHEAFLREDVLADAGLENTGYMAVYDDGRSLRAADGRSIVEASWGGHEPFWNLIGNGGLISTATDFVRLRQAFTDGRLVSPDLVELIQTMHIPEDEAGTSHYGYGLVVQDASEVGRFYWHDGGNDVFSAQWVDLADQGVLILTAAVDSQNGDAFSAMATVIDGLYDVAMD